MRNQPDRGLINGAAVVLVFLGVARIVIAIMHGGAEEYLGAACSTIAMWAIAGMVFYLNFVDARAERHAEHTADIIRIGPRTREARSQTGTDAA